MAKDLFFKNVMAAPLTPVSTGNAKADEALRVLQTETPEAEGYAAAAKTAAKLGPAVLLTLLDDAAVQTGQSRWSDEHVDSLDRGDKKVFKKHYDAVLRALAVRKAYLGWLIGAVCNTPEGLARAIVIATTGTSDARVVASQTLHEHLASPDARRRFSAQVDLAAWNGKDRELERAYRAAVSTLAQVDPAAAFEKHSALLSPAAMKKPGATARAEALLFGLLRGTPDPRWTALVLPLLKDPLDNNVLMLLEKLPPDARVVEPVCAYLPSPDEDGYWSETAVKVLARSADQRAVPWLVGALRASWMNWPAAFDGFRKVDDPALAHVVRDWLAENSAPDRDKVGKPLIKHLERNGAVPRPEHSLLAPQAKKKATRKKR